MKKFSFKLETVLKLKQKALDDKMLELARITNVLNEAETTLQNHLDKQKSINSYLIDLYKKGEDLDLLEVQTNKDYIIQLSIKMEQQKQLIKQIRLAVNEKQKEVFEALKDRDILKKLKEKQKEHHQKEFEQKEMIELDDMTISRYKAV